MKPRLSLIAVACIALVGAGAAGELWLRPRALPAPDPVATAPKESLPDPTQVAQVLARVGPRIPAELQARLAGALVDEAARGSYDPLFLLALVGVESGYRPAAESDRGARGLLQLMPSTFAWIAAREPDLDADELESGEDPVVDVRLAVRYFRWLEQRFDSREAALIAYNAGPRNAARALKGGTVPERWRAYPALVQREHARLTRIAEGAEPDPRLLLARNP